MVRKIVGRVSGDVLQQDLEKYKGSALELGATDAKVVTSDMVLIDERVRAKCVYPTCSHYGTSVHCPPYAMDLGEVRKIVSNFHYALFIKQVLPVDSDKWLPSHSQLHFFEIISKIEVAAFYDGYYLAMGFAGGSCKSAFCPDEECSALLPGQGCRQYLKARSAMEAVGMDVFTMTAKVGWDIYPIGPSLSPSEVPHGVRLGLVFIY